MALLVHELWEEDDGNEYTLCLAGPMGDGARKLLKPNSKMISTIIANSHFDAMTKYYEFMNWGKYTNTEEWDIEPYPAEWKIIQNS